MSQRTGRIAKKGFVVHSKMSRQTIILCIFVVLLQWQPWSIVSAGLVPPAGYSLAFTGRITRGVQKYACNGGVWTKTSSSAEMFANGAKLGTYWSAYKKETRTYTYFWNIINTSGAFGESGEASSGLQASAVSTSQVSPNAISEYLAIVKLHRGSGDAERVAFVSLTGTSGGLPPKKALCSSNGASSGVPFTGVFKFYTQDQVPPRVPVPLQAKGTFVENVFVEGKMHYKFLKGKWIYQGVIATISDVAGGTVLGKYGTVSEDKFGKKITSKTVFKFNNPNGFWLESQLCAQPVQMSTSGCAWQLLQVMRSGGYESPLGKYKYLLITSSLGGLPPKIAARTDGITFASLFTAQCHMFA